MAITAIENLTDTRSFEAQIVDKQIEENAASFDSGHDDDYCEDTPCIDCQSSAIDREMNGAEQEEFERSR